MNVSNFSDITIFILKGSIISFKLFIVTIIFSIPLGILIAMGKILKLNL